jgi:hypothetical protein
MKGRAFTMKPKSKNSARWLVPYTFPHPYQLDEHPLLPRRAAHETKRSILKKLLRRIYKKNFA